MSTIASFVLFHSVFDEVTGPELKEMLVHDCTVSREIIRNVMTVLFTLAAGVGEPTGENQTAIIPLNVTDLNGTVLIHTFGVADQSARGLTRIESFMLYVSKQLTETLFQFTLEIKNIFERGVSTLYSSGLNPNIALQQIFENIRKILLIDINDQIQSEISSLCEEKEKSIVSDGIVRAFHNVILTPELINSVGNVHRSLLPLMSPPIVEEAFENLPIEIHGANFLSQILYFVATKTLFNVTFTSGKGRVGILARPFKDLVWMLTLEDSISRISHPPIEKPLVFSIMDPPPEEFIKFSTYSSLLSDISFFKVEMDQVVCLATTNLNRAEIQGTVAQLMASLCELSYHMTSEELLQLVFVHGTRYSTIALLIPRNMKGAEERYILVGESEKGVGLLRLIGENFIERELEFFRP